MAARGALWLSVGAWSAKGTQTVVLLVLAKALAPSQFGILAVAALTFNVLTSLGQLGVGDALTYLNERVEDAFRTALSMVLAGGLALMAAAWALAPAIASFFHSPAATFVLRGFAIAIPFDAVTHVPVARLTRALRFSRRAVTDTLPPAVGAAVTIGVVVSGHPLAGLVAGQITGSVVGAAVAFLLGPGCLPGWDPVLARRLLRYGGYLSAADMVNLGLLNVDYLVVGHVLGPVALGLYSLAYRICFLPYLSIAFVANGAVFPYYCRLPSRAAIGRAAGSAYGLITALSMPWFVGLMLFAGDVALLGAKWAPAAGAVRFLAAYGLFLSLILTAIQVLKAVGRSKLVLGSRGLHLAILTAVLVVTARMGITVVALDQALVAGAVSVIAGWWIVRHGSVRPAALARSAGLPLLGALGMLSVTLLLDRIPGLSAAPSWKSLLIAGSAALAVYAAITWLVMSGPFREGWAALRGGPPTAAGGVLQAAAGPPGDSRRRLPRLPGAEQTTHRVMAAEATRELAWSGLPRGRRSVLAAGGVLGVVALGAGVAVGHWLLLGAGGLAAAALIAVMLSRADLAVAVLAAAFFFQAYLVRGQGLITVDKGIGAIAVLAWGLDWAVNRRPVLATRQLWLLGAFLVWIGVSFTAAVSYHAALVTSLRYVIFATLYFLVVQSVRGDRRRADALVRVMTVAAATAGLIGLIAFFSHHVARASGPIFDPNDFGFLLASSLPLVIYQLRWEAARWRKAIWALCLTLIATCILATFSRSALTGLVLALAWAIGTGRLRLRWLAVIAAAAAAIAGAGFWLAPQVVHNDFHQKAYIAIHNVDVRFKYYRVEVSEWRQYPVTGVGPGNFVYRFYQFAPGAGVSMPFPSGVLGISGEEAYLVILAEQGAPGLLLFLGYLALSWADLRRRFPGDPRRDQLQGAIAAGFIVACIGALFLAEQYYPPLWFLPALGASLASGAARGPVDDPRAAVRPGASAGRQVPSAVTAGQRR